MRANFNEALGEIDDLCERLYFLETGDFPDYEDDEDIMKWLRKQWQDTCEYSLYLQFEHAYHHLNFGWNCRHYPKDRIVACGGKDCEKWEKFPKDWPEFWPSINNFKGKVRPTWNGKLSYLTMRIPLAEVLMALGNVIDGIDLTFPECAANRCMDDVKSNCGPITELSLKESLRFIYAHLNEAWNSRKLTMDKAVLVTKQTMMRHRQYPRAFTKFWPKEYKIQSSWSWDANDD